MWERQVIYTMMGVKYTFLAMLFKGLIRMMIYTISATKAMLMVMLFKSMWERQVIYAMSGIKYTFIATLFKGLRRMMIYTTSAIKAMLMVMLFKARWKNVCCYMPCQQQRTYSWWRHSRAKENDGDIRYISKKGHSHANTIQRLVKIMAIYARTPTTKAMLCS